MLSMTCPYGVVCAPKAWTWEDKSRSRFRMDPCESPASTLAMCAKGTFRIMAVAAPGGGGATPTDAARRAPRAVPRGGERRASLMRASRSLDNRLTCGGRAAPAVAKARRMRVGPNIEKGVWAGWSGARPCKRRCLLASRRGSGDIGQASCKPNEPSATSIPAKSCTCASRCSREAHHGQVFGYKRHRQTLFLNVATSFNRPAFGLTATHLQRRFGALCLRLLNLEDIETRPPFLKHESLGCRGVRSVQTRSKSSRCGFS